jgi:hypothetical protein
LARSARVITDATWGSTHREAAALRKAGASRSPDRSVCRSRRDNSVWGSARWRQVCRGRRRRILPGAIYFLDQSPLRCLPRCDEFRQPAHPRVRADSKTQKLPEPFDYAHLGLGWPAPMFMFYELRRVRRPSWRPDRNTQGAASWCSYAKEPLMEVPQR